MLALLTIFRRVPLWIYFCAAVLTWGAWQKHRATAAQTELRELQAAAARTTVETLTRAMAGQQEAIHEAHAQTDAAETARAAAAGALGRLLERNRAAGRSRAAAPAAAGSAAAEAGACVPADVFGSVGEAAGQFAAAADLARIAGLACEASYDATVKATRK